MAFNGSGTYVLPGSALVDGQTISATEHNTFRNDVATALTTCVTRDGQSPTTANLPMGGFKLTGLAAGSGNGESVRYEQVGTLATAQGAAALAGATFTGPVLFDTVADIASDTSIDLTAYGSGFIATVTGTTPTTTFVMSDGQFGTLVAAGAWPLTYNATTNKIQGGISYTNAAGARVRVFKTGGVIYTYPEGLVDLRGTSKVVAFTRDMTAASGSVNVTGFGGTPVSCEIVVGLGGAPGFSTGYCASDLSQGCVAQAYTGNMTNNATAIFVSQGSGLSQSASVTAFSADTVTLSWTRTGSTTAGTATGYILARF